jgi:hypothetical protein
MPVSSLLPQTRLFHFHAQYFRSLSHPEISDQKRKTQSPAQINPQIIPKLMFILLSKDKAFESKFVKPSATVLRKLNEFPAEFGQIFLN